MTPPWQPIYEELRRTRFAAIAGAQVSMRIPLPDHVLGPIINEQLPPDVPVQDVEIRALGGNEFQVKARLKKAALLPPFPFRLRIERQPQLPHSPILTLLLETAGLGIAGPVLKLFADLPPGITFDGHRIQIDLASMARQYNFDLFYFLKQLQITTEPGRFIVAAVAGVDAPGQVA